MTSGEAVFISRNALRNNAESGSCFLSEVLPRRWHHLGFIFLQDQYIIYVENNSIRAMEKKGDE